MINNGSVIVIGAGLAGLAAGRALIDRGIEMVVLEARHRPGGRIYVDDGFDYGAGWIHGTEGNPITNLARKLGFVPYFTGGDSSCTGGWERLAIGDYDGAAKDRLLLAGDRAMDRTFARVQLVDDDPSLTEALEEAIAELALNEEDSAAARWHMRMFARDDLAEDPDKVSARFCDEGYELFGYGDSTLLEGIGALAPRLADGLPISYGAVVEGIKVNGESVTVTTADGRAYHAARAIVTVPLGVLKQGSIVFDPPLTPLRDEAIRRLGVGALAKISLRYSAIEWPAHQYVFAMPPGRGYGGTMAVNRASVDGTPEVILIAGGDLGRQLEAQTEGETTAWAHNEFQAMIGKVLPPPVAMRRSQWTNDPFARGCYAYIACGSHPRDIRTLAEPVGDRLFFAGEATSSDHWGTVHGAYLSGLRAAAEVTGDWNIVPPSHFTENRRWRAQVMRANRFFALGRGAILPEETARRVTMLAASEIFAEVDKHDLAILAGMLAPKTILAGEQLCAEGEPCLHAWIVEHGRLGVDKTQKTVATLGPGKLTGEYGLFSQQRRSASLIALEDTALLELGYDHLERFLHAYPQAALALLRSVISRAENDFLADD